MDSSVKKNYGKCSVGSCTTITRLRRGYCDAHYARLRQFGDVHGDVPIGSAHRLWEDKARVRARGVCSIDGCDKPLQAKEMCSAHYYRARRYGNPLEGGPVRRSTKSVFCKLEGCNEPSKTRDLCQKHYSRDYHKRTYEKRPKRQKRIVPKGVRARKKQAESNKSVYEDTNPIEINKKLNDELHEKWSQPLDYDSFYENMERLRR